MRTLTLVQPWATLIALGAKTIETRSWYTPYRGPLYIHAGKNVDGVVMMGESEAAKAFRQALRAGGFDRATDVPRGVIVCQCVLSDVRMIARGYEPPATERLFGNYQPGRYAWHLTDVQPVVPIPARGSLGLWECDLTATIIERTGTA